jgi:CelD/BcsL family acetyltransferase involved in cellulose biosynthesis
MTVEWIEDPSGFVGRDWSELALADPEGTIFHTPAYLKLYWEELGEERPLIGIVSRGGVDVAAAAFEVRNNTLGWLGGRDVTDYMGPVGQPESRDTTAKELVAAMAGRDDWREADLGGLLRTGRWLHALVAAAADAGLESVVIDDVGAPYLALPPTHEEYLARLPGKLRHELRRKERRLSRSLPGARLVDATPDTVQNDLTRFIALHRASGGPKGTFMQPGTELFFRRLAEALLPEGTFRVSSLDSDGQTIAAAVGFRWRDEYLLYNSAFDREHERLSPGIVLVEWLIRSAIEEGRRGFDLLKDDLPYKLRFGAGARRLARLRLRRENG